MNIRILLLLPILLGFSVNGWTQANCSGPKAERPPECSGGGGINSQIPVCATFLESLVLFDLGSDNPPATYCNGMHGQVTLGGGFRMDTGLRGKGHDKADRTVRIHVANGDNCKAEGGGSFQGFDGTTDVDLQVRPIRDTQFLDMKKDDILSDTSGDISIIISYKLMDRSNAFLVIGENTGAGFACEEPPAENPVVECTAGNNPCTNWTITGGGDNACLREGGEIVARCDVPFGIDICADINSPCPPSPQ